MNPTKEQLEKINLYTRRTLTADEIFVFTINLCDTNIDKDYERFSKESIYQLSELLIGKSGVFDRENTNITARIFDIKVIETDEDDWDIDEDYARLVAYAYMVKSDNTKEIIKEIDAGIKKEVSIGCAVEKVICSICGRDMKCNSCEHKKGNQYAVHGFNGKKYATCHHILENPTDAYEWSFVAVPAQRRNTYMKRTCECGKENPWEAKFCMECGSLILTKKEKLLNDINTTLVGYSNIYDERGLTPFIRHVNVQKLLRDLKEYLEKSA